MTQRNSQEANNTHISIGEFAKLVQTTKRRLQFYDKKELLLTKREANGYRYYSLNDLFVYNFIYLLSSLGIPLREIKKLLTSRSNLNNSFKLHAHAIQKHIAELLFREKKLHEYIKNIAEGSIITGSVEKIEAVTLYVKRYRGTYDEIGSFINNFISLLPTSSGQSLYVLYPNGEYDIKQTDIVIGVKASGVNIETELEKLTLPVHSIFKYAHLGPARELIYFWSELEKLAKYKGFQEDTKFSYQYEVYIKANYNGYLESYEHVTEICLPIIL